MHGTQAALCLSAAIHPQKFTDKTLSSMKVQSWCYDNDSDNGIY